MNRTSPVVLLQNALLHLDRGEPREALALLTEGTKSQVDNPAWPVFQGLAHADLGNLDDARRHLSRALKMEPENRLARGLIATVWLRAGNAREALKIIDTWGIEASPRLVGRLLVEIERALNQLGAGEGTRHRAAVALSVSAEPLDVNVEAERREEKGVSEGPRNPPWDTTPHRRGFLDRAVGAIVDPIAAQKYLGRAERHLLAQAPERALQDALAAVHRHADIPRGFCILGLAYLHSGQPKNALRCLDEAVRHDGETPDVLYAQGCCYHETGDLAKARDRLTKMLAAFAKDAAAHYTLGQIDLEDGRELDARLHFEQAAFLDFLLVKERVQRLKAALKDSPPRPPYPESS